ncbi:hypothetical protein DERP_004805 [Dermatophagoides pteronyssinus]|uniref:Uncharacterized protein n=1 Tax=Dermatophagoides pteronyssinus TaxID=6956 RepID=A0ABQ8JTG2_DERPT|nr:hypothetical protein DERP_004805 [Dermatophagoides pteronyssinus]
MFGSSKSNKFFFESHDDDDHGNLDDNLIDRILYQSQHSSRQHYQQDPSLSSDEDYNIDNIKWLYTKRYPQYSATLNQQNDIEHHNHYQTQHQNIHHNFDDITNNVIFQSDHNHNPLNHHNHHHHHHQHHQQQQHSQQQQQHQQQHERHHTNNPQNVLQQQSHQQSSSTTLNNHQSEISTQNLNTLIYDNDLLTEREREYYKDYDPMVGYRIALSLGIIILIFIIFVLYKTHCQNKKNRRLLMNAQQNIQMSNLRTSTTTNDL